MYEKRLVEHANDYIRKMAKGINPLTGEFVLDDDLINNVKISRCLFYVAEVLDDYCNLLEGKNKVKGKRTKFYARAEELACFEYSNEPIYVSVIADKINECVRKDKMRKLSATSISNWLVSRGLLVVTTSDNGKMSKRPTSLGEEIGIETIVKDGKNGSYTVNIYNVKAQKFIVDNIEDISIYIQ